MGGKLREAAASGPVISRCCRSLLLPDPHNMPADRFVGQEQIFRVVFLGEFFLVGNEVMNARMTSPANHEATLVHLLFAEAAHEAFLAMNPSGDQVVLRQGLLTTAQFTTPVVLMLLRNFRHE